MQMNINILLIIALALCLWRAYRGFRVGMAEEIYRLISLVVALFVLALSIMAISSFMDHNNKNGIVAVILIIITGIVFHLLSIVLNSLKTVAKLPIISFFNSILGIAAGVLEVAVALWILYSTSTACKHKVSGSLSLPSRGPFHLSFTVLCAIGH